MSSLLIAGPDHLADHLDLPAGLPARCVASWVQAQDDAKGTECDQPVG